MYDILGMKLGKKEEKPTMLSKLNQCGTMSSLSNLEEVERVLFFTDLEELRAKHKDRKEREAAIKFWKNALGLVEAERFLFFTDLEELRDKRRRREQEEAKQAATKSNSTSNDSDNSLRRSSSLINFTDLQELREKRQRREEEAAKQAAIKSNSTSNDSDNRIRRSSSSLINEEVLEHMKRGFKKAERTLLFTDLDEKELNEQTAESSNEEDRHETNNTQEGKDDMQVSVQQDVCMELERKLFFTDLL